MLPYNIPLVFSFGNYHISNIPTVAMVTIFLTIDLISLSGTCAVILFTGQLLHEAKNLVFNKGIHPNIIRKSFEDAAQIASLQLEELKFNLLSDTLPPNFEELMNFTINPQLSFLKQIASTTLSTKIDNLDIVQVFFSL